jgi:hypothetical protein
VAARPVRVGRRPTQPSPTPLTRSPRSTATARRWKRWDRAPRPMTCSSATLGTTGERPQLNCTTSSKLRCVGLVQRAGHHPRPAVHAGDRQGPCKDAHRSRPHYARLPKAHRRRWRVRKGAFRTAGSRPANPCRARRDLRRDPGNQPGSWAPATVSALTRTRWRTSPRRSLNSSTCRTGAASCGRERRAERAASACTDLQRRLPVLGAGDVENPATHDEVGSDTGAVMPGVVRTGGCYHDHDRRVALGQSTSLGRRAKCGHIAVTCDRGRPRIGPTR